MRFTPALVAALLLACGSTPKQPTPPTGGSDVATGSGSAQVTPDLPPKPPTFDETKALALDPAIKKGVLPNGLTYYVKQNAKPEKRVHLWLVVNAGSVQEDDDQRGLAHMLEHLAFEGTKRFPKHDIQDFIEKSGMKFGADLNAFTSFDETVYQLMVPSDDPKTVTKGLDVLRDWAADITMDPKESIAERKIIEEERRTRNSSQFRMLQQIIPVAFAGSKYANRLPIGTPEVINSATAEKLTKFYKSWYRPELMAVVIAGDVDASDLEAQVKAKFGDIPATAGSAAPRVSVPMNVDHPPRVAIGRDKEQALVQVSIDYLVKDRPLQTVGDVRRYLVESMFARLVSERMSIITKRPKATWTSASVGTGSFLREVDQISLEAQVKDGKTLDAIGDLASELARVVQHGFSAEEIEEAKAAVLQSYESAVAEVDTRDSRFVVDEMSKHFLAKEYMVGAVKELEIAKYVLPGITNEQLVAVAKGMKDTGRLVSILAPTKAKLPTEAEINAKITEGLAKQMPKWEAIDLSAPIIAATPAAGTITAERALANGITHWTLSNGATVLLKPTDFKKDEVLVAAVSNGGTSVVADAQFPQALFAGQIVNAMGVGNYAPEELGKKLAGKKAGVQINIEPTLEKLVTVASPNDLEAGMQLLHGAFVEPRKDPAAFDSWKAQQLQFAQLVASNVQAKFFIGAFDALFDKHPRIPLPIPTEKKIAAIDLDKALAQYKARVANAADYTFTIIGAFEPAKIKPLVEKYLASLPAPKGAKRDTIRDVGLKPHKGKLDKTLKAGDEAKAFTMLAASSPVKWSFDAEADLTIIEGVLQLEMLEILREKLGGTYSVNVEVQVQRDGGQYSLALVIFESDPARAADMQKEAWAALDTLATTAVKDATIEKVKEQITKTHATQLQENAFWLQVLERSARYGDDIATTVDIQRVTKRVTADNIKKAAAQFVGKANRTTVTQLPEK